MRIFFSTGEVSGDQHAAKVLICLKKIYPHLEAVGIGGNCLQKAGCQLIASIDSLNVLGLKNVLAKLFQIIKTFWRTYRFLRYQHFDCLIFVDFSGFNLTLARWVPGKKVYFIPPKVWIWNRKRVRLLAKYFSKVLCILPFEENFLKNYSIQATYIGNPLTESIAPEYYLPGARQKARQELKLSEEDFVICIMPGSRPAEIKAHLELCLEACHKLQDTLKKPAKIIWPTHYPKNIPGIQIISNAYAALAACDIAFVKSGTSTLEAGLIGCRQIVFYKPDWFLYFLVRKVIGYKGNIGLVNLALGQPGCVPELAFPDLSADHLVTVALQVLHTDTTPYQLYIKKLQEQFFSGNPSQKAAQEVVELLEKC